MPKPKRKPRNIVGKLMHVRGRLLPAADAIRFLGEKGAPLSTIRQIIGRNAAVYVKSEFGGKYAERHVIFDGSGNKQLGGWIPLKNKPKKNKN